MKMVVLLKELREIRWKFIIGLIVIALTGISLPFLADYIPLIMDQIHDAPMPDWLLEIISEQLGNYPLYLWANWYGKNLFQFAIILAVVIGGPLIASEYGNNTIEFLLSRPVSRKDVFITKVLVGTLVLGTAMLLGTLITIAASYIAEYPIPVLWFLSGLPAQFIVSLLFMSLAVLFSILFKDGLKAGVLSGSVAILVFLLESLNPFDWHLLMGVMTAEKSFTTGRPDIIPILIVGLLSFALLWSGLNIFQRKDIC